MRDAGHVQNAEGMQNVGCRKRGQVWNVEAESQKGIEVNKSWDRL